MHILLPSLVPPAPYTPASSVKFTLTLLGPSTAMSQLWAQLRRLAPHARTVLLTGSPDCGQEAAARLLLDLSPAPQRTFLTLRNEEAEAKLARPSSLQTLAQDAFLFFPEVERLSTEAQQGLLRLLRLRRSRLLSVVAACPDDLRSLVGMGRFSPELAEALGTVRVALPSLSERLEDLPMLLNQLVPLRAQTLGKLVPSLSEDLLRAAMQHAWHGNMRELSDVVDDLLRHPADKQALSALDLQRALRAVLTPKPSAPTTRMVKLDTVVQEHICSVLRGCRGNKLRAAEVLGISRSTLYRMLDAASQNHSFPLAS